MPPNATVPTARLSARERAANWIPALGRQPAVSVVTLLWALTMVSVYPLLPLPQAMFSSGWTVDVLAPVLAVVVAATYRFPIHLRHNMKLYMATVPLFILAATVAPPLAFGLALASVFGREWMARRQTGAYVSDVVTVASVAAVNVLVASILAHLNIAGNHSLSLLTAAAALWALEGLTLPIAITPISGERPWRVVAAFVRSAGVPDAVQIGIGILGALLVPADPWALILIAIPAYFIYASFKNVKEMHENTREVLARLADAVDLRDSYTGGHSRRVAELTETILRAMGKRGAESDLMVWAARVHDIGKIGIRDTVLLKDGWLDPEERAEMETHPDKGAEFLRQHREFSRGVEVVRHHHERWDGQGYPSRLKGQAIPWGARIVAVADSFDAMTSDRPYRKGLTIEIARTILIEGRGAQWDPEVIDAFLRVVDEREQRQPANMADQPADESIRAPAA